MNKKNLFKKFVNGDFNGCHSPILYNKKLNAHVHYDITANSIICYKVIVDIIPIDGANLYDISVKEVIESVYTKKHEIINFIKKNGWFMNSDILKNYSDKYRSSKKSDNVLLLKKQVSSDDIDWHGIGLNFVNPPDIRGNGEPEIPFI